MIDLDLLATWLTAVPTELQLQFKPGPRLEEFQRGDRLGLVLGLSGIGLTLEGGGDVASFQIRTVAREFEEAKLRKSIFQIDNALLFSAYPADVWGTRIQWVDRSGGQPESQQQDALDRVAYVCSYIAHETPER
jgi:hypothetical protein